MSVEATGPAARRGGGPDDAWALTLAAYVESFRLAVFRGGLTLVAIVSAVATARIPGGETQGGALVAAMVGGALVTLGTLAATPSRTTAVVLHAIQRRRRAPYGVTAAAIFLLCAVHPLRSQLWAPACGLMALLAVALPWRRVVPLAAAVLAANLAAHLLAGDLDEIRPVTVVGLWVGFPFWIGIIGRTTDRLADQLVRAYVVRHPRAEAPSAPARPRRDVRPQLGPRRARRRRAIRPATASPILDRLDHRELTIVALLAAGLEKQEVVAYLGLGSAAHFSRLLGRIVAKAGVRDDYALVHAAMREWHVPAAAG